MSKKKAQTAARKAAPITTKQVAAAFAAWETDFRDKPADFLSSDEVAAMEIGSLAESRAIFFMALLKATATAKQPPCEQCAGSLRWRPPYARCMEPCDLCTSAPISAASATTTALDAPLGSKA